LLVSSNEYAKFIAQAPKALVGSSFRVTWERHAGVPIRGAMGWMPMTGRPGQDAL